jgi:hypothetical protein
MKFRRYVVVLELKVDTDVVVHQEPPDQWNWFDLMDGRFGETAQVIAVRPIE